jgi:hypothetical protein
LLASLGALLEGSGWAVLAGSAMNKGLQYCVGGLDVGGNTLDTVQIYQP